MSDHNRNNVIADDFVLGDRADVERLIARLEQLELVGLAERFNLPSNGTRNDIGRRLIEYRFGGERSGS